MYGSMTTVTLLMLWLYVCMYIFLVCAEANLFFGELFDRLLRGRRRPEERHGEVRESGDGKDRKNA